MPEASRTDLGRHKGPAERYEQMSQTERTELLRRFQLFCEGGNDNRAAGLTMQEAELLVWLANRD